MLSIYHLLGKSYKKFEENEDNSTVPITFVLLFSLCEVIFVVIYFFLKHTEGIRIFEILFIIGFQIYLANLLYDVFISLDL